jgi:hypothetical protein
MRRSDYHAALTAAIARFQADVRPSSYAARRGVVGRSTAVEPLGAIFGLPAMHGVGTRAHAAPTVAPARELVVGRVVAVRRDDELGTHVSSQFSAFSSRAISFDLVCRRGPI